MPMTSSIDYVKAGIADILHALQNPLPNSPLAPLTDSQVLALKMLMLVLHGMSNPNQPSDSPLLPSTPALPLKAQPPGALVNKLAPPNPAASLRVQAPSTSAPALRVPNAATPDDATICTDNCSQHIPLPPTTVTTMPHQRSHWCPCRSAQLRALHATHTSSHDPCLHFMALHGNAFNLDTGELAEYKELSQSSNGNLWQAANTTEIHQLAQGNDIIPRTNTMFFIPVSAIPKGKCATYLCIVCTHRPEKTTPHCIHWTMGGDQVEYFGDVSTKTTDIVTTKLLFNSVISTPGMRCMIGDLKDFYLGTPMLLTDYAYMHIPVLAIPNSIMEHYKLHNLVHNGHVYVEIRKGMYGLPQAGRIANEHLQCLLLPHGYHPCPLTPSLWQYDTRDVCFTLVMDDFAICYTNRNDVMHLLTALQKQYQVTEDWNAMHYCGLTLTWDYDQCTINLSMPGYINHVLQCFCHPCPTHPEHAPHA